MNINATIFIQAINFFIVYCILRIFLFKPVVLVIDHEQDELLALLGLINQQKKTIEIQEKERLRYRYDCHEYFKNHGPDLFQQDDVSDEGNPVLFEDSLSPSIEKDITVLVADVYKELEEKIKHVH